MAERKKLGCFSTIAIIFGVSILGTAILGNRDSSEEPVASQTTPRTQASQAPEPSKTATQEPKSEEELQTDKVCLISKSGDGLTRQFIRKVGDGSAKYTDNELLLTSIKTLQTSMADNPKISQELEAALLEQIELRRAIINHIISVEDYDDVNQYLSDFSKINQNYLRHEDVGEICGY